MSMTAHHILQFNKTRGCKTEWEVSLCIARVCNKWLRCEKNFCKKVHI